MNKPLLQRFATMSPAALPIVTGLFIGTSYIPFPPWAILFGIVPLCISWLKLLDSQSSPNVGRAFFYGWISQFILNLIGFHWIAITAVEFGHFPLWAGVLTLLAFCAVAHAYYGVAGAAAIYIYKMFERRNRPLTKPTFVVLTLALFAFFEALWPSIFPWHLGYTWLWANWPGAQTADLIGFEGLNLVTLACNALFTIGWIHYRTSTAATTTAKTDVKPDRFQRIKSSSPYIVGAISLFAIVNIIGRGRSEPWTTTDASLKIIMAQGNIGNYAKLIAEKKKEFSIPIIETYQKLSIEGFAKHPEATHVLWPETAFPDYLDATFQNEPNWIRLRQFAIAQRKTILTGAYSHDFAKRESYNGFFAMTANGEQPFPPYRKSILIPFGEKFPFSDIIPYMKWLFPGQGSFGGGDGPTTMDLGTFKLGPQICLESLYPWFSASMAKQGAEIFSNITNDSWFGQTFEPYQHMTMTLARAVENRRPLLRSTNTGITTVILASGQILERSPLGKEWVGYYEVPFKKNPAVTMYSKIAGYSAGLAFVVILVVLMWPFVRNLSKSKFQRTDESRRGKFQ